MAFVWPTLSQSGRRQTIMGRWDTLRIKGYALGINPSGNLEFWVGDGQEVDYVSGELPSCRMSGTSSRLRMILGQAGRKSIRKGTVNRYNSLYGRVVPDDYAHPRRPEFPLPACQRRGDSFLIARRARRT